MVETTALVLPTSKDEETRRGSNDSYYRGVINVGRDRENRSDTSRPLCLASQEQEVQCGSLTLLECPNLFGSIETGVESRYC